MNTLVVIPTYNEKENIKNLVEKILNLPPPSPYSSPPGGEGGVREDIDVLIVDDNSPDGTGETAEQLAKKYPQLKIIHRKDKRSEGLSRRDGYHYALTHNYDYIIEMDADLSHNPEEIPNFLEAMGKWDVVIGSRFINGSKQVGRGIFRRLGSRLANFYIRKMLKIKNVYDCASGYRCYRREVLEKIDLDDVSFTGPASLIKMLFKCYKLGFKIKEIPITYQERRFGKSKKKSLGFIIEALWTVFKLRFAKTLNEFLFEKKVVVLDPEVYLRRRERNFLTRYRFRKRVKEVLNAIKKYKNMQRIKLLDIGAADGTMLSILNSKLNLERAIGIEPSLELRCAKKDNKIEILGGEGENLPFKENEFDVVILASVIEHVREGDRLVTESYRVLKKSGLLIMTAVDPFFDKIATFLTFKPKDHIQTYNLEKLKKLFINTGFQIKLTEKFGPLFYELIVGEK